MREGNLTRAAERLHLSQSALSSQLRQLEDELGLLLFRRNPRGMELSDAARELVPLVEGVLEAAERLARQAQFLRQGGGENLTIGLNADPVFLKVGALNQRLAALYDDLRVVFVTSQSILTPQLLRQRQVDLTFFYGEVTDSAIHALILAEVRFCVVIPTKFKRGETILDWSEVAALPWVWVERGSPPYDAVRHHFEKRQLSPCQAVYAGEEYVVKELVAAGQGVAVMREDEARPLLESGAAVIWEKGWLELPLCLGWLAQNAESRRIKAARAAIEYLWRRPETSLEDPLSRISY